MTILIKTFTRLFCRLIQFILLCCFIVPAMAQPLTQTIRGTVLDKVSQSPMQGAVVVVLNSNPLQGGNTDANGQFILKNIAVGRQTLKVTYLGYKEQVVPNVIVNSGKEVVLTIQMEEQVVEAEEVVIKASVEKNKPLNEMSTVSTRTFSVEETQKFAAAVNDPARMATSFAGVVGGNDGNNMISIRGNSPNGLLWRMEGVDIPNPNHYSSVGTSGGGVSILSAQLLSNSDFMTGAFASEYGNALGGVFDLKLRKGNNQRREYTLQAGVLGLDVATEGPFKKGYDGSYVVNYRYSTLSLLGLMGVNVAGDATLDFQDLSFNVSFPTKNWGTFGVFGFGGLSKQTMRVIKDSVAWKEEAYKQFPGVFASNTGAVGINNMRLFGPRTYLKTTLVFTGTENKYVEDKLNNNYAAIRNYEERYLQGKVALSTVLTHKFNAKNSLRSGVILSSLNYDLLKKDRDDSLDVLQTFLQTNGNTATVQAFTQWNHKLNSRLTTNAGVHYLLLTLNNSYSIEPRASVKYDISAGQNISLGYGLHGQTQPLGAYFARNTATGEMMNRNLQLSKAHHLVLSHDIGLAANTHLKTEVYYQHLFNIPISADPSGSFSMLNVTDGYAEEALTNHGKGKNYGLELTLERFTFRNFYYLLSVSVYESKFKAANNQWYDTRFNTNYATTFTAGKEWQLSERRKGKVLGVNTKVVYTGGLRRSPIDLPASISKGETVYDDARAFTLKNPDYFRIDLRVSIKRNYANLTSTLSLDLQNATNHQNIGGQYFDKNTGDIKFFYQTGLIPVLAYKVEF